MLEDFERSLDEAGNEKQRQLNTMNDYLRMMKRYTKSTPPTRGEAHYDPTTRSANGSANQAHVDESALMRAGVPSDRILQLSDAEEEGLEIDTQLIDSLPPSRGSTYAVVLDQTERGGQRKKILPLDKLKSK